MSNIYRVSGTFRELARQIERERRIRRAKMIGLALAVLAVLVIYGRYTQSLIADCEQAGYSRAYCVRAID